MTSFDLQSVMRPDSEFRREPAEHYGVDRPDPRAGKHGVRRFRDHRQIDGDAIAASNAHGQKHIGKDIHLAMQLAIGDVARRFGGIVRLPDDSDLVPAFLQVTVDAIGADIERAVLEPFNRDVGIGEACILDEAIGLDPIDPLALLAPELVRLIDALLVELLVLVLVDEGVFLPVLRDLVDSFLRHRPAPPYALRSLIMKLTLIMNGSEAGDNHAPQRELRFSGSEGSNDRAHDDEYREPMAGIDDCHNGLRATKGLVRRRRG